MSKFEGTVEDVVFRNEQNGWTVASVRLDGSGRTSVVGILPFLKPGEHAIFEGELVEHRDYGEQIRVSRYETTRPETGSAIEKYLSSGLVRGVGPATAKLIVKKFGARTLDIIESEPDRLTEIAGIGKKRAQMIAESFASQNEMRNTLIFLQNYGLTPALSMKVYRAYGEMTERVLRANPYRLVDEIDGVGFRTADSIARSLGFAPESEFRLRSGVKYVLNEAVNGMGHVYLPENLLIQQSCRILGADEACVQKIANQLILDGNLIAGSFVSPRAIYPLRLYEAECETARLLLRQKNALVPALADEARLNREIEEYERDERVHLCKEQREAVISAATDGVMVITGGPGTGKTTSINCIIRLMRRAGAVELCAPTGRAAKRMSEATGCAARTLHRLLEYGGEGQGFARDEDNPLDADVVIVDEMSMV
ncbi:MAG: helix-hairpin-helix domain-containing protein, partial [Candidatus Faecivicinus sp.]|nr:helix-hairpin-helix domain-containing protein [Candidatus Faecivicinus sp.]